MKEVRLPYIGFAKFSYGDFLFAAVGLILAGNSFLDLVSAIQSGQFLFGILAVVSGACGLGVVGVSILQGRRRVQWEEWVNPVAQWEAFQRHALAEGL